MAREISIKIGPDSFSLAPIKVERKKLYGWTELKVVGPGGEVCKSAGLDSNGVTVIPKGAVKMGMVSSDGKWVDKSELKAVHSDGTDAQLQPSTFDAGIVLDTKATAEDLLDLLITSVYVLDGEGAGNLAEKVGNDIYSFRFNYNADYEDLAAYLLSNGQSVFILTGEKACFEYVSLEEQGSLDSEDNESEEIELDDLDFGMM